MGGIPKLGSPRFGDRSLVRQRRLCQNASMLTVHHLPELRQPAVLCAVSGWSDAGQAASGALGYLLTKWSNQRFAEFDSDEIYNYTVTRPATTRPTGGARRKLTWPDFAWFALPVPHAERDLVVLLGPEPDPALEGDPARGARPG